MTTTARLQYKTRLLTPGPTAVPEAVLLEMAQPIIHHRTSAFKAIFKDVSERLQRVCRTKHPVLTITGSGTTAFEACQINLARPGSKVLTIAGGKFGERWQDIYATYASFLNITNIKLNADWGSAIDPQQVADALKQHPDISVVAMVHSETSTATAANVQAIAQLTRDSDALLLVDGITSVGALPVEMDAWGIDALVTGSQKALMLPPGLGFAALGQRAQDRLDSQKAGPVYNLDLRKWLKSWRENDVPFTPPVSLIRGQRVALEMIETEGLENIWQRSARLAHATRAAFEALGLKCISTSPSDSVSGFFYPQGIDDKSFRAAVRDNHGIAVAGGQDGRGAKWKTSICRISHMGYVDLGDTMAAINAIETELRAAGHKSKPGTALAALVGALA